MSADVLTVQVRSSVIQVPGNLKDHTLSMCSVDGKKRHEPLSSSWKQSENVQSNIFIKRSTRQSSCTTSEALVQFSGKSQVLRVLHSGRAAWRPRTSREKCCEFQTINGATGVRSTMISTITLRRRQTGAPSLNTWLMETAAGAPAAPAVTNYWLLHAPCRKRQATHNSEPRTPTHLPINPRYYFELKCCIHSQASLILMGQSIFHSSPVAMGRGQWLRHRDPKVKQLRWVSSAPCALSER